MLVLCVVVMLCGSAATQCVDQQGRNVDWSIMFKMPNGYSFLYADANTHELQESESLLTEPTNPVARVLKRVYSDTPDNYLLFNDEVPDGHLSARGHTKGIVVWDEEYVTWIIHSAPNFPPQREKGYSYPPTAMRFGQSFLCLTLDVKALPDLVTQLYYSWPMIYESNVADSYKNITLLQEVINGKHVKMAPWSSEKAFQTASTRFMSFSKSAEFSADLYKDLISPYFNTDLYTETWQNGAGRLPSNCTGDRFVKNMVSMNLLGNTYKESQDHSKWAISGSSAGSLICVGGINRMRSQTTRGGGSVCFVCEGLWRQMFNGIQDVEDCAAAGNLKYTIHL